MVSGRAGAKGYLAVVDLASGRTRWQRQVDSLLFDGDVVAAGQLAVVNMPDGVLALDINSGTVPWRSEVGSQIVK